METGRNASTTRACESHSPQSGVADSAVRAVGTHSGASDVACLRNAQAPDARERVPTNRFNFLLDCWQESSGLVRIVSFKRSAKI
jgi:hypothetical protein